MFKSLFPRVALMPHIWEVQEVLDDLTAQIRRQPSLFMIARYRARDCSVPVCVISSWCGRGDQEASAPKGEGTGRHHPKWDTPQPKTAATLL